MVLWGPRSCSSVGVSRGEFLGGLEGPSDLALGDILGSAEQSQPSSRGAHMILPCFLSFPVLLQDESTAGCVAAPGQQ